MMYGTDTYQVIVQDPMVCVQAERDGMLNPTCGTPALYQALPSRSAAPAWPRHLEDDGNRSCGWPIFKA
jgi:hypothetical protein